MLLIFIDVVLKIFVDVTGEEFQKLLKDRAARRHGAWSIYTYIYMDYPGGGGGGGVPRRGTPPPPPLNPQKRCRVGP